MDSLDRIAPLLARFRVRTSLFHTGPLCGVTEFPARAGRGFLHILRAGEMDVTHRSSTGSIDRRVITEPSLIFYPRPLAHAFHNAPQAESDFACAALEVEGGENHPLVRTLPPLIVLPLHEVEPLGPTLDLLFAEVDNVRCGHRILADRLFEIVLIQLYRWMLDHTDEMGLPDGLLPALADERLAPLLVALHEDPSRNWTLTSMARVAAMSRSAFAAHFRDRVGQTPADYLAEWRIVIARDELLAGTPVAVTASRLGYSNPAVFSRAFRQRTGESPREWLRRFTAHSVAGTGH